MLRDRTTGLALLACILIAWGSLIASSNPVRVSNRPHNETTRNDETNKQKIPVEGWFLDEHGEAISALATIFIAAFTGTLWWSTRRQALLTRASIDLGNKEFITTHRPKIRVRYIAFPTPQYGVKPTAEIHAANAGESDATLFLIGADIFLGYPGAPEKNFFDARPKPWSDTPTIPPGKEAAIGIVGGLNPLTSEQVGQIIRSELELRMVGIVIYRDRAGIERSSSFARIYDPKILRLRRVGPDDQYAEWDYED